MPKIIEYYYTVWKLQSDYVKKRQEKRNLKCIQKITQVYIPNSSKLSLTEDISDTESHQDDNAEENYNSFILLPRTKNDSRILCVSCQRYKLSYCFLNNLSIFNKTTENGRCRNLKANNYLLNEQSDKSYDNSDAKSPNSKQQSNLFLNESPKESQKMRLYNHSINLRQSPVFQLNLNQSSKPSQLPNELFQCNQCWAYWKKYGGYKFNYFEANNCKLY